MLRPLLASVGPSGLGPWDLLGEGVSALLAELFLLILGNAGASSFRECGIWLLVSADSQHFLGLKLGQVLCVAQQILLPVQLSDPPGGGVSRGSFFCPWHQGNLSKAKPRPDGSQPNQSQPAPWCKCPEEGS